MSAAKNEKKCPNCGRCAECGHVPQPPQVVPWPYPYPVAPYRPPWPSTWQPQPWISRPTITCGTANQPLTSGGWNYSSNAGGVYQ